MIRKTIPILICILVGSALGTGYGALPPLQGAKIVSEGAYFWLEISNNWTESGGRIIGTDAFLRLPRDFSVHATCVNYQEINALAWVFNDSSMQTVIPMNLGDKAEVLLSAPFLSSNETIRRLVISAGIIPESGGLVMLIDFPVSVLSLAFLQGYDELKAEYEQTLNQSSSMNQTVDALESQLNNLSDQVWNLAADKGTLNQRIESLNNEVASLNSRLAYESFFVLVAAVAAALGICAAGYLAIRRRQTMKLAASETRH